MSIFSSAFDERSEQEDLIRQVAVGLIVGIIAYVVIKNLKGVKL